MTYRAEYKNAMRRCFRLNMTADWHEDTIQFPRLITEIAATHYLNLDVLADSMDLEREEVEELFERATTEFESIKNKISTNNS